MLFLTSKLLENVNLGALDHFGRHDVLTICTSLWQVLFPKTTADSEILRSDIKNIINTSKSPTKRLMIPKKFLLEISTIIEISTNSDSHGIIEYQIFCSVFCILQVNLGETLVKLFLLVFPILHTYQWILTMKIWYVRIYDIMIGFVYPWKPYMS